ncbi:MAG TPA: outer membrane beta-barrel family protein [Mucilaginibacter sp.]|nr:outer membrane beta-barrel family protein [Mucilaginibacter sp.]
MKPKNYITYLLLIVVVALSTIRSANAQTPAGQVSGTVTDSVTRKAPDFITVILKTGTTPVKSMITKADGTFAFTGLKPLKYTLTLSAIGYQTKSIAADLSGASQNINLGTIPVSGRLKQLKEVAIVADKPLIKQEVDRISYDLQADPESKGSNVLQMLRKLPYVSLDADENILLKGNSSYKILINGKPSSMVERNPRDILRSIPASTIQRIEVITTPPAKYDAEGLGGIINIITNKKIDNGYNGTVNLNGRYHGGPGVGSSFTFKEGKLGVSAFGGGSIYNSPLTNNTNTRNTTGTDPTSLVQQGNGSTDGRSGYFGTELSYEIDSLNLISGQFNINGDRSTGSGYQNSLLTGMGGVLQGYNSGVANRGTGKGLDASLNYQLGFKANKSQLLTFSYRYTNYSNLNIADVCFTDRVNYPTADYDQTNHAVSSEQTFQIDYVQPFKKVNMEAGVKAILRDNNSDFQYSSLNANGGFDVDPTLSNSFLSSQDIYSLYNTWQYVGKGWGVKAGLRIEQTVTDADFLSTASTVHQNYFNIFPSFAFNKDFKDRSGINLGFTQRVKRPSINKLNPFVDRSNPNFQSSGNPALRPVVLNDIQLAYHVNKKASVNIGFAYDFVHNLDLQISSFDPNTNITYTTYQNQGKANGLGSFLNINYPITKQWNISLNARMMRFWLTGFVNGVLQESDFYTASSYTSTSYKLDKGWRLNAALSINGRNPTGLQGSTNGFTSTSFGVNKELVKNKLNFSASVNNPFAQYRYSRTDTHGIDFTQSMNSQVYFRSFSASLNYNFGKLKEGVKKTKRGINNDDK